METHSEIIKRIGIREVARLLGHNSHTTVQGWAERNSIPMEHWAALVQATEETEAPVTVDDLMPPELRASTQEAA